MKIIKIGDLILSKDKMVCAQIKDTKVTIAMTTNPIEVIYNSEEEARQAFEVMYEQLNKK